MKFTEGYWEKNERANASCVVQVDSVRQIKNGIRILAVFKPVNSRADQLDNGMMELTFTACGQDVVQAEYTHFKGYDTKEPRFQLQLTELKDHPEFEMTKEEAVWKWGKLSIRVGIREFYIRFERDGKLLTAHSSKNVGYMRYNREYSTKFPGRGYLAENGTPYILSEFLLTAGTNVYGLGERFTAFVKNGQSVDCWNEDGGTASQVSYKNIPFYITDHKYGVFVDHSAPVSFEVASEKVEYVGVSTEGESLRYYLIMGENMKEVLGHYSEMTGRPPLVPAWSFGLWLSTSFTTEYEEETAMSFVRGMEERQLPLDVFHFDCFWMKAFHWCDFEWNPDIFPCPEEMLERYHRKGLKVCVWINPYISQNSQLFDEGKAYGYFLMRKDGLGIRQMDNWQPGMAVVDFTNPGAVAWYQKKLKKLLDMGVDCFKTDFGERIPIDVAYYDGSDPYAMHNYYTYIYNRAVFELLIKEKGEQEAVLFARSATAGSQQFPVHWGGDCIGTFESMAETLRGGLSLSLSGFAYWSHDIGGFEETAKPAVYKRWLQFGLLSTHSRLHGSKSYRVPWMFGEEAVEVCREFTRLKLSLMPYLYRLAIDARDTGMPIMRPMILEYESDPAARYLDQQYMLGPGILVAPIFNEEGRAEYYLPEGTWTHLISGEERTGGRWYVETYDFHSLPLFVAGNTLLPVGDNRESASYHYPSGVEIRIYRLEKDEEISCMVPNEYGVESLQISAIRRKEKIILKSRGENQKISYCLINYHNINGIYGGHYRDGDKGIEIYPDKEVVEIDL